MSHICNLKVEYADKVETITDVERTSGVKDNFVAKLQFYKNTG